MTTQAQARTLPHRLSRGDLKLSLTRIRRRKFILAILTATRRARRAAADRSLREMTCLKTKRRSRVKHTRTPLSEVHFGSDELERKDTTEVQVHADTPQLATRTPLPHLVTADPPRKENHSPKPILQTDDSFAFSSRFEAPSSESNPFIDPSRQPMHRGPLHADSSARSSPVDESSASPRDAAAAAPVHPKPDADFLPPPRRARRRAPALTHIYVYGPIAAAPPIFPPPDSILDDLRAGRELTSRIARSAAQLERGMEEAVRDRERMVMERREALQRWSEWRDVVQIRRILRDRGWEAITGIGGMVAAGTPEAIVLESGEETEEDESGLSTEAATSPRGSPTGQPI